MRTRARRLPADEAAARPPAGPPRSLIRRLVALAGLLAATEALLAAAPRAGGAVVFDVGPSTGGYGAGFTESEERPPTTFRWTRDGAGVGLPLIGHGGEGVLVMRYGRPLGSPVEVEVRLSGQLAAEFEARPGRFRVVEMPVRLPRGPLRIDVWPKRGGDPGVAVDWIRIEGGRWGLPRSSIGPRLLVAGTYVLCLAAGFPLAGALTAGALLAAAEAAWLAWDPFGFVHVAARIAIPSLLLSGLSLLIVRGRPGARWVTLIFLAGYLLKGAGLFHPGYFYNDVRNNRRFAMALARPEGTLLERRHAAQVAYGVAYPRIVAGEKYAFPYSPAFYLPATLLPQNATTVDEFQKHLALALACAEVVLVFWISGLVFGPASGVAAALFAATFPVFSSRLLLSLWAALAGHALDTLLLGAGLGLAARPGSRARLAAFAGAALGSLLTYVASLFNVALFAGFFALLGERRLRYRVLAATALAGLVAVGLLYADFTLLFVTRILPDFLAFRGTGPEPRPDGGVLTNLTRIPLFYGWGYPSLAVAGFVLARRRASAPAVRVLTAWALSFAALVALRALPGGLFKDLKEVEFVAPLVAVLAGAALEELWGRGRSGRVAAVLVALGLVAFGLLRYLGDLRTWTALAGA